jgi:hypothetical protein
MRNQAAIFGTIVLLTIGSPAQAVPEPIKPLPLNLVAGTYERTIQGYPATMTVKTVGPNKIDFVLTANVEIPKKASATVKGVLPFRNNIAVFKKAEKSTDYSISMRFTGGAVILIYTGTGFGAPGLDPAGVYRRVSATSQKKVN